ncbi:thioesterase-like superfamily-domain-containing protein [Fusarium oxysporum f. sp. albedinis]|nr:thioesterase-like superfamily-domain-containing protein [Fusarium oxysporum f. sp. albedinis]KAJ9417859.1 thioesterase-like superfamily-domain-containing protein [Fusarium oxysporum]
MSLRFLKRPIKLASRHAISQLRSKSGLAQSNNDLTSFPSRWFADLQAQLKEFTSDHYPASCVQEAKRQLVSNEENWLQLLAGQQGFLTDKKWRGLDNHQLLWGDMDSIGHVNNVMYNRYVETGRVHFIRQHSEDAAEDEKSQWDDLPTPRSLGLILRSITTEYKFPLEFPDHITVLYKLLEAPTNESTSLKMEAWILSEQYRRLAARCIDDTVIYDYTTAKKTVLKPFMVDKFQQTFSMQQANQRKYTDQAKRAIQAAEELQIKYK